MPSLWNAFYQRMNKPNVNIGAPFTEDYFSYIVNVGTGLTAASVTNTNFQIQNDADFEWLKGEVYANEHGATEPMSDAVLIPFLITIQDAGSGEYLTSGAAPVGALFGIGKLPHILPCSRVFSKMSVINLQLTSISPNTWDNLYLVFEGRKIRDNRR